MKLSLPDIILTVFLLAFVKTTICIMVILHISSHCPSVLIAPRLRGAYSYANRFIKMGAVLIAPRLRGAYSLWLTTTTKTTVLIAPRLRGATEGHSSAEINLPHRRI